jgi:hypothetical protein
VLRDQHCARRAYRWRPPPLSVAGMRPAGGTELSGSLKAERLTGLRPIASASTQWRARFRLVNCSRWTPSSRQRHTASQAVS